MIIYLMMNKSVVTGKSRSDDSFTTWRGLKRGRYMRILEVRDNIHCLPHTSIGTPLTIMMTPACNLGPRMQDPALINKPCLYLSMSHVLAAVVRVFFGRSSMSDVSSIRLLRIT